MSSRRSYMLSKLLIRIINKRRWMPALLHPSMGSALRASVTNYVLQFAWQISIHSVAPSLLVGCSNSIHSDLSQARRTYSGQQCASAGMHHLLVIPACF